MNRRRFLAVAGGGIVVAAGAGVAGFVGSRTPHTALRPWIDAGSLYTEPRMKALSYAILAPNPHNLQPWLVDLAQPDRVILHVDPDRLLPLTDPPNRQIAIGLGCFLELMRMAAGQDGFRVDFDLFPAGEDENALDERPVAIATFSRDASVQPDPLFAHVLARRSLKEPFDLTRPVSSESLARLEAVVENGTATGSSNQAGSVDALRRLTHDALLLEIETPHTFWESVDLFRIGKAEIEANPDGIDFSGPMFEALHMAGMFTRDAALDTGTSAYEQGRNAVLENTDTAMAHL
ncbi:MAG: twin-arginine translocation pathway signal protein, partial [Inquilinus sp.]|nr:twin-arginine translocation pathway signal protein [Inquilinus sp.]